MFNHILVPLDNSPLAECVLPHLLTFAQTYRSEVTLLNVLDQVPTIKSMKIIDPFECIIGKIEANAYLQEVSDRLRFAGLPVTTAVTEGRAADSIINYAQLHKVDLIVLSSHGLSGLSGWNISSVVQKVLYRAYTSLLIIPAYQPIPKDLTSFWYKRVMVPLDGSQRAEWVLPFALKLIALHCASLLLAHVIQKPEMPSYLPLNKEEIEMVDQIVERNRQYADKYLTRLYSQLPAGLFDVLTHLVVSGNPIGTLRELVDQESVDLVILSAHGHTGGSRRLYGSVTLSFITYGTTPLLILQDLSPERIAPTRAEMAASEQPKH